MKKKLLIIAAAALCISLTACEGRSNKGFTEAGAGSSDESSSAAATTTAAPAETTAGTTAETAAATEETAAETAPTAETAEAPAAQPETPDTEASEQEDSSETTGNALGDAYHEAAKAQAQLLMTASDAVVLMRDISGDPLPDGTYKKGDGSDIANSLDSYTDIVDYTIVIENGKTVSATVVTEGDNGTVEETVTADIQ